MELPWDSASAPPYKPYIYVNEDSRLFVLFWRFCPWDQEFKLRAPDLRTMEIEITLPGFDFGQWKSIPGLDRVVTMELEFLLLLCSGGLFHSFSGGELSNPFTCLVTSALRFFFSGSVSSFGSTSLSDSSDSLSVRSLFYIDY
mmetsp:Transcript_3582/g.5404  ORF Transcript_3582/g.5404 Transcript_3582/m.5404 type:complete len:143 (-) Transcript_3582:170-598(-)